MPRTLRRLPFWILLVVVVGVGGHYLVFDVWGFEFDESVEYVELEISGDDPEGAVVSKNEPSDPDPDTRERTGGAELLEAESVVVEGRVVSEAGTPIPRFTIEDAARDDATPLRVQRTDGIFRYRAYPEKSDVTNFEAKLEISASGFVTRTIRHAIPRGGEMFIGDVQLTYAAGLRGLVVDRAGKPLPDARVRVEQAGKLAWPPESYGPIDKTIAWLRTGDDGTFASDSLPHGRVRVWARSEGTSWSHTRPFRLDAKKRATRIRLVCGPEVGGHFIRGIVVDPTGSPLPYVNVDSRLYHPSYSKVSWPFMTTTNAEGEFELRPVVNIQGVRPDWAKVRANLAFEDQPGNFERKQLEDVRFGTLDLRVELRPQRRMRIRVLDAQRQPVEAYSLGLRRPGPRQQESSNFGSRIFVRPQDHEDWPWIVLGAPREEFAVHIEDALHRKHTESVDPRLETIPDLTIELRPRPWITGRVTAQGRPVANARIQLAETWEAGIPGRVQGFLSDRRPLRGSSPTITDARGEFRAPFEPRKSGAMFVLVSHRDWAPYSSAAFRPDEEGHAVGDITLIRGGTLVGRAPRDSKRRHVCLARGDGSFHSTPLDRDGEYRFDRLQPGRYQIELRERGFATSLRTGWTRDPKLPKEIPYDLEIFDGRTTRHDFVDGPAPSLALKIQYDGKPAVGWKVRTKGARNAQRSSLDASGHGAIEVGRGRDTLVLTIRNASDDGVIVELETTLVHPVPAKLDLAIATGRIVGDMPTIDSPLSALVYSGTLESSADASNLTWNVSVTKPHRETDGTKVDLRVPAGQGKLEKQYADAQLAQKKISLGTWTIERGAVVRTRR